MTIYSSLKKRAVRKPIILKRARKAEGRVLRLQAVVRGFLTRVSSEGRAVEKATQVGRRKHKLLDGRYHAARKI